MTSAIINEQQQQLPLLLKQLPHVLLPLLLKQLPHQLLPLLLKKLPHLLLPLLLKQLPHLLLPMTHHELCIVPWQHGVGCSQPGRALALEQHDPRRGG